jgi:hypothetical protein
MSDGKLGIESDARSRGEAIERPTSRQAQTIRQLDASTRLDAPVLKLRYLGQT